MKKTILTVLMLCIVGLTRAESPANSGEQREWLTSFTAVEVTAPVDLHFLPGPRHRGAEDHL